MPKFSIIVPVYMVEDYIEKCLESIRNQKFKDYEVLIIDDGTKDKSIDIAEKYPYKIIHQKNQGLSAARNKGVSLAKGEYLIFLDSDDYIDNNFLEKINASLKNKPDIVRYQVRDVYLDGRSHEYREPGFTNLTGDVAFSRIVKYHYVENAWCYAIKRSYYLKENFTFQKGSYHEDFGLIPLVIMKATSVNSISDCIYNYVKRDGSIMNSKDYSKTIKKVDDFYKHYHYLMEEINKTDLDSLIFKSFISNSLILKITELNNKDYKIYLKKLREEDVFQNLLVTTFTRKLKKLFLFISPKMYYHRK